MSGRRPRRENGEDDSLSSIAREAEARLAAKRAARAEAREIRLKELEKQQREMDDTESQNGEIYQEANGLLPRQMRPLDVDYSSTNGSSGRVKVEDSTSALEEKYKKAMVQNAQLDNEKTTIHYENEHMRDLLEEVEDRLANCMKELNSKSQEAQRYKTQVEAGSVKLDQMREIIRQKDQIIQDGGLIAGDEEQVDSQQLLDEVEKLRNELIQEQQKKSVLNDEDLQLKEKLYQETKSRANKAEQEVESQKAHIARLEGQVSRYKAAAEHYENSEDNLKAEKRRLQRELRQCQEKLEETELTVEHLEKRLDKIRAARQKS